MEETYTSIDTEGALVKVPLTDAFRRTEALVFCADRMVYHQGIKPSPPFKKHTNTRQGYQWGTERIPIA
jgi:hypothetical protein